MLEGMGEIRCFYPDAAHGSLSRLKILLLLNNFIFVAIFAVGLCSLPSSIRIGYFGFAFFGNICLPHVESETVFRGCSALFSGGNFDLSLAGLLSLWCAPHMVEQALLACHDLLVGERLHVVDCRVTRNGCLELQEGVLLGWLTFFAFKLLKDLLSLLTAHPASFIL